MARMTLIDINANDELPAVIRKCNDNFRRVSSQQSLSTSMAVTGEAERSDEALADAMQSVGEAIRSLSESVDKRIDELKSLIDRVTQPKMFAPPVGSYLFSEADPSETWPGTEWERQAAGHYLVAAEDGDAGTCGRNSYVLSTDQMPQHSHTGPAHTHSHAGSGAAASSNGAHTHNLVQGPSAAHAGSMISTGNASPGGSNGVGWGVWSGGGYNGKQAIASSAGAHTHSLTGSTGSSGTGSTGTAGGSAAIDNMPLSIKSPLWKRTE